MLRQNHLHQWHQVCWPFVLQCASTGPLFRTLSLLRSHWWSHTSDLQTANETRATRSLTQRLSVCLSVCLSACLPAWLAVCIYMYPHTYVRPVRTYVYMCVCRHIYVCMYVCKHSDSAFKCVSCKQYILAPCCLRNSKISFLFLLLLLIPLQLYEQILNSFKFTIMHTVQNLIHMHSFLFLFLLSNSYINIIRRQPLSSIIGRKLSKKWHETKKWKWCPLRPLFSKILCDGLKL